MPFLTDRTLESLQLLKSFSISMGMTVAPEEDEHKIPDEEFFQIDTGKVRKEWGNVLQKASKTPGLRLERLHFRDKIHMQEVNSGWPYTHLLAKRYGPALSNLEELSLDITCADIDLDDDEFEGMMKEIKEIKKDLWCKLAPKTVKGAE